MRIAILLLLLVMAFVMAAEEAGAGPFTPQKQCPPNMTLTGSGLNKVCVCVAPYVMVNGSCQPKPTCTAPKVYNSISNSCVCPSGMLTNYNGGCSCPTTVPYWCVQKSMCMKDSNSCFATTCSVQTEHVPCSGGYYVETCTTCPGAQTTCTNGMCNVNCTNGIDSATGLCRIGTSSSGGSSSGGSTSGGSTSGGGSTGPAAIACTGGSYGTLVQVTGSVSTYEIATSLDIFLENGSRVAGSSQLSPMYLIDQNAYNQRVCEGVQEALDNAAQTTDFYVKNNPGLDCTITAYKGSTPFSVKCHTNTVAQ